MTRILVVYGSRHGGTRGIADRIGEVLRAEGIEATVAPADEAGSAASADAFVVGSGVYMGSWLNEPLDFMRRNLTMLAARPTWLFSSGPLPGSTREVPDADPVTVALGPVEGPGSGGRRKVEELAATIHPRDHAVFLGAFDPDDPPKAISERFVRLLPISSKILPPGDFRNWDAIEAWAKEIAAAMAPAAVG
jgi:menaquinone-dependent protoporphyrinogen oxidase